ncbi:MAG: DUF3368 domain-containing protein [Thermoguttaceae bacterium]|jgi:predicted nucleic acid-binding protein|nr:DUF3368 domain-containing protein [Thermoguttaceae bacterium]
MGTAVSDTSVLNYLARLGKLGLLRGQFCRLIVPRAVLAELDACADLPGTTLVREAVAEGWMELAAPESQPLVMLLRRNLGLGESHAIALAVERSADFVLLDELEGRRHAAAMGIPVVGTLGVLLRAKRDGSISQLAPLVRRLVEDYGFRLDAPLVAKTLEAAGETPTQPAEE